MATGHIYARWVPADSTIKELWLFGHLNWTDLHGHSGMGFSQLQESYAMYKMMMAFLIASGLFVSPRLYAQETQKQKTRYYYYPSSNVYLDPATHNYWYFSDSTGNWVSTQQLPSSIKLKGQAHYTLYYEGMDVWKQNALHRKKYPGQGTGNKQQPRKP